eukprot:UN01573
MYNNIIIPTQQIIILLNNTQYRPMQILIDNLGQLKSIIHINKRNMCHHHMIEYNTSKYNYIAYHYYQLFDIISSSSLYFPPLTKTLQIMLTIFLI